MNATVMQRLRRAIMATVALSLLVAGVLAGAQTIAEAGTVSDPGFEQGSLRMEFVDAEGELADPASHVFDASGAYPGMPAQRSVMRLRNTGTLPALFDISTTDVRPQGPRSLDEVLLVAVEDRASGKTLYRGRLSGLRIRHTAPLQPGESAAYALEVTWPDHQARHDAYQGASLVFSLTVGAESAGPSH